MTSGDNNHMDTQLEALLQSMPQPRPSAELDAAILADAEAALAKNPVAPPLAANDAVTPESANAKRPAFLTRWKVPLAFAATVMLAVHIVGLQWFAAPVYDAPEVSAAAPAAPAAPATPPADAPQSAAPSSTASELRREAPAAKPMLQARAKEAQPQAVESRKDERALSTAIQAGAGLAEEKSGGDAGAPAALAKKSDAAPLKAEAAAAPPLVAAAPAQAPAAAPAPASRTVAPVPMAAPAAPAAIGEVQADTAKLATRRAESQVTGTVSSSVMGLSGSESSRAREAPQAAAAAAPPAKMADASEARASRNAPSAGAPAGGSAASVSADIGNGLADRALKSPRDWLIQIDKLITDGKPKEALEEWTRFRKQYPDYLLSPEQKKRIDGLKQ